MRRRSIVAAAALTPVFTTFVPYPAPTLPDAPDAQFNLGIFWALTTGGAWWGNRILLPSSGVVGATTQAYNQDTATLLASQPVPAGPGGTYVDVLWPAPLAVAPGVNYLSAWNTTRYAFRDPGPWPTASADGKVFSGSGSRTLPGVVAMPTAPGSANFYIAPLMVFP